MSNHDKQLFGYLTEHPNAHAAVVELAETYGEQIGLLLIDQPYVELAKSFGMDLRVLDLMVKDPQGRPLAIVSPDGETDILRPGDNDDER